MSVPEHPLHIGLETSVTAPCEGWRFDLAVLFLLLNTHPVVEAIGMWESRRDFQRAWKGWEAGLMAFQAFRTLSFPRPAFERVRRFGVAGQSLSTSAHVDCWASVIV